MFPGIEYIKTCLNGLRSKFDKLAQDTNGKLQASTADWNQNDPDALDYVKGRTHYEANGKVVQLPPKFLPSPTSNTVGAIKADVAKTTDIQPVRLGTDGKLYVSGIPVFTASETTGVYRATVPEITKLVNGMLVVMIPNTDSTSQYPRLSINGEATKIITRPVSTGGRSTFISLPNLKSGIPYLLIYTGSEWLSINNVRPDAFDLTNFVGPSNGGTGLTNLTKGSYIIGNGLSSVKQKTPAEVLADIGAIPVPTTASVGQVLAVKAVDKNGKPTEWEAADMEGGWELITDVTLTEDGGGAFSGVITRNDNGEEFEYRQCMVCISGTVIDGWPSGASQYIKLYSNNDASGNNASIVLTRLFPGAGGSTYKSTIELSLFAGLLRCIACGGQEDTSSLILRGESNIDTFKSIQLSCYGNSQWVTVPYAAGGRIVIYGRK